MIFPPPQEKPARRMNYAEKVKAGLVVGKARQRINPVSSKRAREGAEYTRLRAEFLKAHPVCQFPGCGPFGSRLEPLGTGRIDGITADGGGACVRAMAFCTASKPR